MEFTYLFLGRLMPDMYVSPDQYFDRNTPVPEHLALYRTYSWLVQCGQQFEASSFYAAHLWKWISESRPDMHILVEERRHWQLLYAQAVRGVIEQAGVHPNRLAWDRAHFMWRGQRGTYTGRPRCNIAGHQKVPVYKVLWPLFNEPTPIFSGYPRKAPICGDKLSVNPAQSLRLCVNPRHFENTQLEHAYEVDDFTRPGQEHVGYRIRWRMIDVITDGDVPTCPQLHYLPDYHSRNRRGLLSIDCRGCKEQAQRSRQERGRDKAQTRNRYEPTIAEVQEQRSMQRAFYEPQHTRSQSNADIVNEYYASQEIVYPDVERDPFDTD